MPLRGGRRQGFCHIFGCPRSPGPLIYLTAMPKTKVSLRCPMPKYPSTAQPQSKPAVPNPQSMPCSAHPRMPRSVYLPWDIPKPKRFAHTRWKSSVSRQCPGEAGRRGEVAGGRVGQDKLHHPQPTSEFLSLRQSTLHSTKRNLEQDDAFVLPQ